MNRKRGHGLTALLVAGTVFLAVAGCSSGETSDKDVKGGTKGDDDQIKIALLQKQGDQQYFKDEATGAKDAAKELGNVDIDTKDLATDPNKAVSAVEAAIADEVDGIVIVVPTAGVGPQVVDLAREAGIPLIAADDAIEDADGKPVDFVGFDGTAMGMEVGKKAAKLYKKAGWTPENTKIMAGWQQDLETCNQRVAGATKAFTDAVGKENVPETVELGTDNSVDDAQSRAENAYLDNSDTEHWVVWGCNDENETGIVKGLSGAKVGADDIIGVGLGAYLTCKDWAADANTGNKAALYIGGPAVGATAVKTMVGFLRDDKEIEAETFAETEMVDATNWEQSGLECT